MATAVRKDGSVAVAFFGDGAVGEGVLYEAMNFAAVRQLPVVFVCENNLYSTHLPIRECRVSEAIADIAAPLGVVGMCVDGNDVIAVFEAASELVGRGRRGEGPGFLECKTYRLRGHVGPDDNIQGCHTDIRPPEEVAAWRARDPIARCKKALEALGIEPGVLDGVVNAAEAEVKEALAFARASAFPVGEELGRYVYA